MTRLEEIAKRAETASAAPWYALEIGPDWDVALGPTYGSPMFTSGHIDGDLPEAQKEANAKFAAHARADIPHLLALVRKLCDAGDGILNCWECGVGCGGDCEVCKLRAAIAEAKG